MTSLLADARALAAAGISVIPLRPGTKVPAIRWKEYQSRIATDAEIRAWFEGGNYGLGIVTGAVSGNLEMTEIEGRALPLLQDVSTLAADSGLGPLWSLLHTGWLEKSPSGGLHWFYRTPEQPPGNTKIANRKATPDELAENPAEKVKVLAETRGEGGYVVAAPTDYGTAGKWQIILGGVGSLPTLTADQREDFHALLSTIGEQDAEPAPAPTGAPTVFGASTSGPAMGIFDGLRPGDDFNQQQRWEDMLPRDGWTRLFDFPDGGTAWRRPGKHDGAMSATTGRDADADRLYVFSTSVEHLPTLTPIDKFGYIAYKDHGGNFEAAAAVLKGQGYGKEPERIVQAQRAPQPATDGNVAYLADHRPEAAADAHQQPQRTPVYTDDGNAQALIARDGERIRYNSTAGRWLLWNGMAWEEQPAGGGAVCEVAKELGREMPAGDAKATKHKNYTLSVSGNTNMLKFASTDPRIAITSDRLDAEAWELNTPGGIVNLATGELMPSDPAKMHTRLTRVTPGGEYAGSRFERFIQQTFPDPAIAEFVQRLLGASIIGEPTGEFLPFALGGGGNGKTAMFEMVAGVLGKYATTAESGFLMQQRSEKHATEIAKLSGARFVMCSEVNEDDKFDEAKVKRLTGGETLTARFMHKDFFDFRPTHQLWLAGNYQPAVGSGGDAFWRRLLLIPFDYTVPKAERQPGLSGLLVKEEGPIILQWMIAGAVEYGRIKLTNEPAAVRARTTEYAESEDNVGQFVAERCTLHPDAGAAVSVTVAKLYDAYEVWCRRNSEKAVSKRSVGTWLQAHGVLTGDQMKGTGGVRRYGGIALVADEDEQRFEY